MITYEEFGAMGDGKTDDHPAICEAHAEANRRGVPVHAKQGATYHLGRRDLTAVIATDTDWGTSRFTIDDTDVENYKTPLFCVKSLLDAPPVAIERLERDQRSADARPEVDCHVVVTNNDKRVYIRRGLNQNAGVPQHDCFVLKRDGSIEGDIDWSYPEIHKIEVRAIDDRPLLLRGGVFTTIANRMESEPAHRYWWRSIVIERSNVEVNGLAHHVTGEGEQGQPYEGFLTIRNCANFTLRDCFLSGHRTYSTIGSAGKPVSMGTYDVNASNVVNFRMIGCRMGNITDRTRWGVVATNFCKNIVLEDCVLSRMDTHMGVSGIYAIHRSTIGYAGINAIGRGLLTVEDSTVQGGAFIALRGDYGSTWEGLVEIRDCRWVPNAGEVSWPHLIFGNNDGRHDFGYPCSMPSTVTIDGLKVDDRNHPKDYTGMYVFSDPDPAHRGDTGQRPYPYASCRKVVLRNLEMASGLPVRISPNAELAEKVELVTG